MFGFSQILTQKKKKRWQKLNQKTETDVSKTMDSMSRSTSNKASPGTPEHRWVQTKQQLQKQTLQNLCRTKPRCYRCLRPESGSGQWDGPIWEEQVKQEWVFLLWLWASPRGPWRSLEELECIGPLELDVDTDQSGFFSRIGPTLRGEIKTEQRDLCDINHMQHMHLV